MITLDRGENSGEQMGALNRVLQQVNLVFNVVTDWLLMVFGLLMIVVAFRAIDVPVARYVVVSCGFLLCGFGIWFRRNRIKKR